MSDPRVDEQFLFSDVAYGPPGGEGDDWNVRPELVFRNQDPWPFRGDVFLTLNADPVYRMETGIANGSNEFIEKVAPADAHSFDTRQHEGKDPLSRFQEAFQAPSVTDKLS